MLKRIGLFFLVVFLVGMMLLSEGYAGTNEYKDYNGKKIALLGSAPGGDFYIAAVALSKVLKNYLNLDSTVMTTGGSTSNAQIINRNEATTGLTTSLTVSDGWEGTGWAKGELFRDYRSMVYAFPSFGQGTFLKSAGIKYLEDLEGRTISIGNAGSTHDLVWRKIFDILDIHPKIQNLPFSDTVNLMRDGRIDGFLLLTDYPISSILDIQTTNDCTIVGMTELQRDKVLEVLPDLGLSKEVIPANTYEGQNEDLLTLAIADFFIAHKEHDEELIYYITKAIIEKQEEIANDWLGGRFINAKDVDKINIPLHVGAFKYLQEIGIEIPEKIVPTN